MVKKLLFFISLLPIAVCPFIKQLKNAVAFPLAMGSSFIGSEYQFTALGDEDAESDFQKRVNRLAARMGIGKTVYCKKMNSTALELFGHEYIFSTHNAIFMSQAWFKTLDYATQEFILAHELAHILHYDASRQLAVNSLISLIACAGVFHPNATIKAASFVTIFSSPILFMFLSRRAELQADKTAAEFANPQAIAEHFKRAAGYEKKGILASINRALESHPSAFERSAQLTPAA